MGYYVTLIASDFAIPEDRWDEAFEALVELNKHDELKTGGRIAGGGEVEKWFAWMDPDYPKLAREQVAEGKFEHPLIAVFDQLGFDWSIDELAHRPASLSLDGYYDKTGGEDCFLEAVAPFVVAGSYLDWRGEDDLYWRHKFNGETMETVEGRVVFD